MQAILLVFLIFEAAVAKFHRSLGRTGLVREGVGAGDKFRAALGGRELVLDGGGIAEEISSGKNDKPCWPFGQRGSFT